MPLVTNNQNLTALQNAFAKRLKCELEKTSITDPNFSFFKIINGNKKNYNVITALEIAYNWLEITKIFMFTALRGLGTYSDSISDNVSPESLTSLQTCVKIISDDLYNANTILNEYAPHGSLGVHYRWWERSILSPLLTKAQLDKDDLKALLKPSTKKLTNAMQKLTLDPIGVLVQLYVVETIALNIARAFFVFFSHIVDENKLIFEHPSQLSWIVAHIELETMHACQVTNPHHGVMAGITSHEQQENCITLVNSYANLWKAVIKQFEDTLIK